MIKWLQRRWILHLCIQLGSTDSASHLPSVTRRDCSWPPSRAVCVRAILGNGLIPEPEILKAVSWAMLWPQCFNCKTIWFYINPITSSLAHPCYLLAGLTWCSLCCRKEVAKNSLCPGKDIPGGTVSSGNSGCVKRFPFSSSPLNKALFYFGTISLSILE